MNYYIIVGEPSGDLHASRLMRSLKAVDKEAEFRFYGGDLMMAEGGTCVKHYRELAYMGFVPVLLHLPTIFKNMSLCKKDILDWHPDVVILVDYPGFNLNIAKYIHAKTDIPVYYYISPKIWAWKEYRIKNIKRDVDELFSILPFEVPFFEGKHHYPIHYVGNPTADEVREFKEQYFESFTFFCSRHQLKCDTKPIVALLAGSRRQEIKDNLPAMIQATAEMTDYQFVLAGAPNIERAYYESFISGSHVQLIENDTYALLSQATAAVVTSGTATLETACFDVPQVVCYETPLPWLIGPLKRMVLSVKYVSLVNLIADKEVVKELVADSFSVENIRKELLRILPGGERRESLLTDYRMVHKQLGQMKAPDNAARLIYNLLRK